MQESTAARTSYESGEWIDNESTVERYDAHA
jgi:hypothetical protein